MRNILAEISISLLISEKLLRSCLVSAQKERNKSNRSHLKIIESRTFTIFPKAAAFIQPSKGTLNDPSFWNNSELVKFITLSYFYDCTKQSKDGISKCFTSISANAKHFYNICQTRCISFEHTQSTFAVSNVDRSCVTGVWQSV